jgi:hypothetical protein
MAAKPEWVTQEQAGEHLDLSARRTMEYAKAMGIRRKKQPSKETGRPVLMLNWEDLEKFAEKRREKATGSAVNALKMVSKPAKALIDGRVKAIARNGESANGHAAKPRFRGFLTLAEAEDYIGLPADHLEESIERGELPASRDVGVRRGVNGRWRVRRVDLDHLAGQDPQLPLDLKGVSEV